MTGSNVAGRVVYWRLEGSVEHGVLVDAWRAAGLDEKLLPLPPTPERALKRALRGFSSKRLLVRPLKVPGYSLVSETAEDRHLEHGQTLTVVLVYGDDAGRPALEIEPAGHELAVDVRKRFLAELEELDTTDISNWLGRLTTAVHAVSLRDKGGVVFVPRDDLPTWDRFVGVLEDVSESKVFQIPAMPTSSAVEAILDAIVSEATDVAVEIENDLADPAVELGPRALATRSGRCESTIAKVGRYEALLGARLDSIRKRIDDLKANIAAASLLAGAEKEAA